MMVQFEQKILSEDSYKPVRLLSYPVWVRRFGEAGTVRNTLYSHFVNLSEYDYVVMDVEGNYSKVTPRTMSKVYKPVQGTLTQALQQANKGWVQMRFQPQAAGVEKVCAMHFTRPYSGDHMICGKLRHIRLNETGKAHGKGDFIVCRMSPDGGVDFSTLEVINGVVAAHRFDKRGWVSDEVIGAEYVPQPTDKDAHFMSAKEAEAKAEKPELSAEDKAAVDVLESTFALENGRRVGYVLTDKLKEYHMYKGSKVYCEVHPNRTHKIAVYHEGNHCFLGFLNPPQIKGNFGKTPPPEEAPKPVEKVTSKTTEKPSSTPSLSPSPSAPATEQEEATNKDRNSKVPDFGKKIGGARKDYAVRHLSVDELDSMTVAERKALVCKNNVWPKPDYEKLYAEGRERVAVYYIKRVRDACEVTSISVRYADMQLECQKAYVEFISAIRDKVMSVRTKADIEGCKGYTDKLGWTYTAGRRIKVNTELPAARYLTNKFYGAFHASVLSLERSAAERQFLYTDEEVRELFYTIHDVSAEDISQTSGFRGDLVLKVEGLGEHPHYYRSAPPMTYDVIVNSNYYITRDNLVIKCEIATEEEAKAIVEKLALEQGIYKRLAKAGGKDGAASASGTVGGGKRKLTYVPPMLTEIRMQNNAVDDSINFTGDDYIKHFGFAGGEFGNWLSDKERQVSLNHGYVAFCDLAKALGVSNKTVALDGTLSIAFGSRGVGGSCAHYEPARKVINLTKMKGAGSLAHEWWHAVDDMLGAMLYLAGPVTEQLMHLVAIGHPEYITDRLLEKGVDKAFLSAVVEVLQAMRFKHPMRGEFIPSRYYADAQMIGKLFAKYGGNYWDSAAELFARAGAAYTADKLYELGITDDYLVGHADQEPLVVGNVKYYLSPRGEERTCINEAFDKLVAALKHEGYFTGVESALAQNV